MYPGGMRIGAEEEKAVLDVLRSKRLFRYYGPYSGASRVDEFEKAFAASMGTGHAVAVSSGYASLVCGLAALGVGPGDEVIVTGLYMDRFSRSGDSRRGGADTSGGRSVADVGRGGRRVQDHRPY
jgi:hypothetical protein